MEQLLNRSRDDPEPLSVLVKFIEVRTHRPESILRTRTRVVPVRPKHSEGFTGPSLSVRENCRVEPIRYIAYTFYIKLEE